MASTCAGGHLSGRGDRRTPSRDGADATRLRLRPRVDRYEVRFELRVREAAVEESVEVAGHLPRQRPRCVDDDEVEGRRAAERPRRDARRPRVIEEGVDGDRAVRREEQQAPALRAGRAQDLHERRVVAPSAVDEDRGLVRRGGREHLRRVARAVELLEVRVEHEAHVEVEGRQVAAQPLADAVAVAPVVPASLAPALGRHRLLLLLDDALDAQRLLLRREPLLAAPLWLLPLRRGHIILRQVTEPSALLAEAKSSPQNLTKASSSWT